jgi:hypothetical protein
MRGVVFPHACDSGGLKASAAFNISKRCLETLISTTLSFFLGPVGACAASCFPTCPDLEAWKRRRRSGCEGVDSKLLHRLCDSVPPPLRARVRVFDQRHLIPSAVLFWGPGDVGFKRDVKTSV